METIVLAILAVILFPLAWANIRAGYSMRAARKAANKEAKRQAKMQAEWERMNNSEADIIDPNCTEEQRDKDIAVLMLFGIIGFVFFLYATLN